ncbi:protein kinase domain-containing protein [Planctomycetaceae bacterium SH139]
MNKTQILIQALQIAGEAEREAFLSRECQGDSDKLAELQRILLLEQQLRVQPLDLDVSQLQQRVDVLLTADAAGGLDAAPFAATSAADAEDPDKDKLANTCTLDVAQHSAQGTAIGGRYVLQHKIGEGGMGEVWAAKQIAPVKRRVALKLIKKGMDSRAVISRFEQERQALALMDHPNIAKVLDAGVTESGQPYFVMELVNGLPLNRFADESRLTTSQRLEIFVPICNAIQHAHQKGVVHRDLKPVNILVTLIDGHPVPKVIDFGVAKATGRSLTEQSFETQFGAVIGTLEYMAPEQTGYSGVDIDTRADIYSLGVVLYELLTGLRPIDRSSVQQAGLAEMIRLIKEQEPSKPSTRLSTNESLPSLAAARQADPKRLTALLQGELDWVVMKCLEKDRDRRYETANGIARDIQRFLSGEIVEARPASRSYRFSKFLRRNRGSVLVASALLGVLIAGTIGTTWGWLEAIRQTALAKRETETQIAINGFLRDDILAQASAVSQSDSLFEPDPELTVRKALDRAASRVNERFAQQPLVAAAIERTIGLAYSDLGAYQSGVPHLERSLKLYKETLEPKAFDVIQVAEDLGYNYVAVDQFADAEELLTKATKDFEKKLGAEARETLESKLNLAYCYFAQGRALGDERKLQKAELLYNEILLKLQKVFGASDPYVAKAWSSLAIFYQFMGSDPNNRAVLDKAEEAILQAIIIRSDLPDTHPIKLQYLYLQALIVYDKHDYERSFVLRRKVLANCLSTYGAAHDVTLRAMDSLATAYSQHSKNDEAEDLYLRSLQGRRDLYGNDHKLTRHALFTLAQFYLNNGDWENAEKYYRERHELTERLEGAQSINTHLTARDLATICISLGRMSEAERLLAEAIEGLKQFKTDDDPIVVLTREYQADLFVELERYDEALPIYLSSVAQLRAQPTPPPIPLASALSALGQCQLLMESYESAEDSFREATEIFGRYLPQAWPTFVNKVRIGAALVGQEKYTEAEPLMLSGFEELKPIRANVPKELYVEAINNIIHLYSQSGRTAEADEWRSKVTNK